MEQKPWEKYASMVGETITKVSNYTTETVDKAAEKISEGKRVVGKLADIAGSSAGQSYIRQFFDTGVWDEGMFDEKESASLKSLVSSKLMGKKSGFSYKDYDEEGGKGISYKGGIPNLADPRKSLKMTLGKASIVRDSQGDIFVVDEYDFSGESELKKLPLGERVQALIDAVRDDKVSSYGLAHLFAEAFGASEGEGASIRAKVGSPEEFGLSAEDVQYLPTLEEYQQKNKGRIKDRAIKVSTEEAKEVEALNTKAGPKTSKPVDVKVKAGDTLGAIAKKFGITVGELASYNKITNPNNIRIGVTLKIPEGGDVGTKVESSPTSAVVVKRGDTLSAIAKANGTTVDRLRIFNDIKDINNIKEGAKLKIPTF